MSDLRPVVSTQKDVWEEKGAPAMGSHYMHLINGVLMAYIPVGLTDTPKSTLSHCFTWIQVIGAQESHLENHLGR